MYAVGAQFDEPQSEAPAQGPSEPMLDNPVAVDDALQALSSMPEGRVLGVVSSRAQSSRRKERRRQDEQDTRLSEVLDDHFPRASNHRSTRRQRTLVKNARMSSGEDADLAGSTWSNLAVHSTSDAPRRERSRTRADAGAMFRQWMNGPFSNDPFCCWTMRTEHSV